MSAYCRIDSLMTIKPDRSRGCGGSSHRGPPSRQPGPESGVRRLHPPPRLLLEGLRRVHAEADRPGSTRPLREGHGMSATAVSGSIEPVLAEAMRAFKPSVTRTSPVGAQAGAATSSSLATRRPPTTAGPLTKRPVQTKPIVSPPPPQRSIQGRPASSEALSPASRSPPTEAAPARRRPRSTRRGAVGCLTGDVSHPASGLPALTTLLVRWTPSRMSISVNPE